MDATARVRRQNEGVHERFRVLRALLRPPAGDVALSLAFTVATVAVTLLGSHGEGGYIGDRPFDRPMPVHPDETDTIRLAVGNGAIVLPLAWRRRLPLAAAFVQFTLILVVRDINLVTFVAALAGAYALAAHGRYPAVSIAVLLAMAAVVAASFPDSTPPIPSWATPFAFLLPIGLFATTIRAARARADASAERARALEHEQEVATRAAVAEERARIARDLHDVVSHHVSVMVIQAGAAGKVLDARPDLARGAVEAIETSGREAMADLRHLLGLLNPAADGSAPLQPLPGLDQLDTLVAKVRAAGQPVTVSRSGAPPPYGVGQVAYRVVQEALTNALRYAPGAPTDVTISTTDGRVVVEVTNTRAVDGPAPPQGAGSGLLGLAERVRLYRGTFDAGRRPLGGFRVRAVLPMPAESS
jgi:signal transduction histidine kinase